MWELRYRQNQGGETSKSKRSENGVHRARYNKIGLFSEEIWFQGLLAEALRRKIMVCFGGNGMALKR
jgi:hypothetical protein